MPTVKSVEIPTVIHLIWLGKPLSDREDGAYLEHISAWKALNPDFRVQLWVDTVKAAKVYSEFSEKNDIRVLSVEKSFPGFYNRAQYDKEMECELFSSASDILRVNIIAEFGGYYFDIGISPKRSIVTLSAGRQGALIDLAEPLKAGEHPVGDFHFHAAPPNHLAYRAAQVVLQITHEQTRKKLPFTELRNMSCYVRNRINICRTGMSVFQGLQALILAGETPGGLKVFQQNISGVASAKPLVASKWSTPGPMDVIEARKYVESVHNVVNDNLYKRASTVRSCALRLQEKAASASRAYVGYGTLYEKAGGCEALEAKPLEREFGLSKVSFSRGGAV